MHRRQVLTGMLTTTALLALLGPGIASGAGGPGIASGAGGPGIASGAGGPARAASASRGSRRPDPNDHDDPRLKALALALHAPSPHNTQAWKVRLTDDAVLLYIDERRLLPQTDPPARQMHLGAGCFIETFVLGAGRFGHATEVALFPEGVGEVGVVPVAQLRLRGVAAADPLSEHIEARQTSRKPYRGPLLTRQALERLQAAAGLSHADVRFEAPAPATLDLLLAAFERESRTRAAHEETRGWFRLSEAERAATGDGISLAQLGMDGPVRRIAEGMLRRGGGEAWHSERSILRGVASFDKALRTSRGLVHWVTATNTPTDWVLTGRDFARFALALTAAKLFAHPLTQATQEYPEMAPLRGALHAHLGLTGEQNVQMVARIGASDAPYYAWRRPVASALG